MAGRNEAMMSLESGTRSLRTTSCSSLALEGPGGENGPESAAGQRWAELIGRVDAAVASGEASAMLRTWQAASVAALLDREWSSMLAVGDAAVRIGRATGLRYAFGAKARQAYQVALYRAHRVASPDGVFAAAEGFAELGDHETVEQCLIIAIRLLEKHPRRDIAHRVDMLRARLTGSH
jgi:hypothetical protein